jgi:FAD-dependent urate hydroxylase
MKITVDLLIIGAGPFGLSMAAWAADAGLGYVCVGTPMEFWRTQMPDGMYLRSAPDWQLDPARVHTLERFLSRTSRNPGAPVSRAEYLAYTDWLQRERAIVPRDSRVTRLTPPTTRDAPFEVILRDGGVIAARRVVAAIGFGAFAHVPEELRACVPADRTVHTAEFVRFDDVAGRRCVIVGGRQSAFEWAALMHEAGAASVNIVHRHATPAFAVSEWEWVTPLVERMRAEPGWYRRMTEAERREIEQRLWSEGRLKLEPWLAPRVAASSIMPRPGCTVVACRERPDGALDVELSDGHTLPADRIVFATGYKVRLERVSFLRPLIEADALRVRNGFPELDEHFQTSVPGLFITSMPAAQDFGPFMAFTVSACVSAAIIGDTVRNALARETVNRGLDGSL